MKKKLMVLGAVLSSLILAGPAWASGPPYTVSVGGSSAIGTHPFTASLNGVSAFQISYPVTIPIVTCTSVAMAGSLLSGAAINPVGRSRRAHGLAVECSP